MAKVFEADTRTATLLADDELAPGFRHGVLFFEDAEEYLAAAVPFLREALSVDEPAVAAVRRDKIELLRAELGAEAESVRFADIEELGANPARIIPFWRGLVSEGGPRRAARGIGEPIWPGRSEEEIDECQRHEALVNFAFDGSRGWSLLCPYDSAGLDDDVLEEASHSHPFVAGGAGGPNAGCLDVPARPFAGTLSPCPPEADTIEFGREGLTAVRSLVAARAAGAGLSGTRREDLVLAASEVAANSVAHGGGSGRLSVWSDLERIYVESEDMGLIEASLTGRVEPEITQIDGRGLWLANQLCDLVQIRSGPRGTRVRLQMRLG